MAKNRFLTSAGNPISEPFCHISETRTEHRSTPSECAVLCCGASRVAAAANKRAKEEKHFMLYFIWVASYVFVGLCSFGVGRHTVDGSPLYERTSVESFFLALLAATSTLNERHEQRSSALFRVECKNLIACLGWSVSSRKRTFLSSQQRNGVGNCFERTNKPSTSGGAAEKKEYYILLNSALKMLVRIGSGPIRVREMR